MIDDATVLDSVEKFRIVIGHLVVRFRILWS